MISNVLRRSSDHAYRGRLAPYLERACRRSSTPAVSRAPRTMWYLTPGRSLTRPPLTRTIECSWRLCPSPGMYAVTSMPLVSRTRATFRSAEFGFFGVVVYTRVHTPRRCGDPASAGAFVFLALVVRPLRTNCCIVGTSRKTVFCKRSNPLEKSWIQIFDRNVIYATEDFFSKS